MDSMGYKSNVFRVFLLVDLIGFGFYFIAR